MKSKRTAILLCLITGFVGGHYIYLRKLHLAKVRFLWFFFCVPVAYVKSLVDLYKLCRMSEYNFKSGYCTDRVEGSGSYVDLHRTINDIEKDMQFRDNMLKGKK